MRWITSANVACGGHAGDMKTMAACVRLAKQFGVRLGAHPGPWSRGDFGRGPIGVTPDELELLLLQQVSALAWVARAVGLKLHHIKLHGALYHAAESEGTLAQRYVAAVAGWWPNSRIIARAGGQVVQAARRKGIKVWEEGFVDRGYRDDGTLVPRNEAGAVILDLRGAIARVQTLLAGAQVISVTGKRVPVNPQTLCLHADTPQAVRIARVVAQLLKRNSPGEPSTRRVGDRRSGP